MKVKAVRARGGLISRDTKDYNFTFIESSEIVSEYLQVITLSKMNKYTTQIKLYLSVSGKNFSPEKLTKVSKIDPTASWIEGDLIPLQKNLIRKDNKDRYRDYTAWEFSTGYVQTLDFQDISIQFVSVFEEKISIINSFVLKHELDVNINLVVEIVDGKAPGIFFNKEFIEFSKELGAEIDIDMYVFDND